MTDTEIIEWLEKHYTMFNEGVGKEPFTLTLIGGRRDYSVSGTSLRDCVRKAAEREQKEPT